ncbi:MAG: hypothetical protein QW291_04525 [Thermofilaceae archaeon]
MQAFLKRRVTREELLMIDKDLGIEFEEARPKDLVAVYEEEGECTYTIVEEVPLNILRKILSPGIIELLEVLKTYKNVNLSDTARLLNRSPSNVYVDLKLLAMHRIIHLEKLGKQVIPYLLLDEIKVIP